MPSSHQHGISNSATRRKAGRKWRHIANAQLRNLTAQPKPKRIRSVPHQPLKPDRAKFVHQTTLPNKLPLP